MRIWKQTKYANYEVSECACIRDTRTGEELEKFIGGSNGYERVTLELPNGPKLIEVHRIVAETFLPKPNQKDKFVVDHIIEDDKTNNHVTNLQWLTQSENIKKSWRARKAKANGNVKYGPKLTERQKEEVIAEYLSGKSLVQITSDMNAKYSRTTSRQTYTKVVRNYANKK